MLKNKLLIISPILSVIAAYIFFFINPMRIHGEYLIWSTFFIFLAGMLISLIFAFKSYEHRYNRVKTLSFSWLVIAVCLTFFMLGFAEPEAAFLLAIPAVCFFVSGLILLMISHFIK